jgi:putative acetyltransferase
LFPPSKPGLTLLSFSKKNSGNPDFQLLASQLEEELRILDGDDHARYAQLNEVEYIEHVLVVYHNDQASACGAIRQYSGDAVEIKRMYTIPGKRGLGIGTQLLKALEDWALRLNYKKCVLETGLNQPGAIAFYKKNNYAVIPNFGKYKNSANSICFEKDLSK